MRGRARRRDDRRGLRRLHDARLGRPEEPPIYRLLPARLIGYSIHISCRNVERPGWAYISEFATPGAPRRANHDEVLAVKLDGSRTVERFAHEFRSDRADYTREPHAGPSRDGSRVLWASDWQRPRGPVYAYVAAKR